MLPKIHDGDLVIARKSKSAENGDIVVCINNSEALIKKIHNEKKKTILLSLNQSYSPIFANDDFRIEGVVRGIISYDF
jgi:repressor LexA